MKKLKNSKGVLQSIIGMVITSIFTFCAVACLYKWIYDYGWLVPSICGLIFSIIGGLLAILLAIYEENRLQGMNKKEASKHAKNALDLLFIISIVLLVMVLFITGVVLEMDKSCIYIYTIISFVSIWVGIIGTALIDSCISEI